MKTEETKRGIKVKNCKNDDMDERERIEKYEKIYLFKCNNLLL